LPNAPSPDLWADCAIEVRRPLLFNPSVPLAEIHLYHQRNHTLRLFALHLFQCSPSACKPDQFSFNFEISLKGTFNLASQSLSPAD
jgi:hypothetical protein